MIPIQVLLTPHRALQLGRHVAGLILVAASLAVVAADSPSSTSSPSVYKGPWRVSQVLINEERGDRLIYQASDPRLLGRQVSIDDHEIDADLPEARRCEQPTLVTDRRVLNTLLGQTMQPTASGDSNWAHQFGLTVDGRQSFDLAWLRCASGKFGPALPHTAPASAQIPTGARTWIMRLADQQMVMRWYGDVLLVLTPVRGDEVTRPSFECTTGNSLAESAICASARLSTYDISLSQAWRYAIKRCEGNAPCMKKLKQDQKRWLLQRNRCNQDVGCLSAIMRQRLESLMSGE